jgi:hypothetical protein
MATGQATEAAKADGLGKDGNEACCRFFPALKGRAETGRIASPQRDAGGASVKNQG